MTDTWTDEIRERYRLLMADGLRAAAERRAALSPEVELELARRMARLGPNLCNVFVGPDNDHGRHETRLFTPDEVAEWHRRKDSEEIG